MASIEHRKSGTSPAYWRVVWYQDRRKQHERFATLTLAERFRGMVEEAGNRWPPGWTPGVGFGADPDNPTTGPTFAVYATKTIGTRLRADEQTRGTYTAMLTNHINPVLGELPLPAVDRFHVAAVADSMIAKGRTAKTVANVHGLLSSILSDAVKDGLIARNPAVGALPGLAGVKGEEMVFLTADEYGLLEQGLPAGTDRDLIRLLVGTGLRWSEATALQVGAVDVRGKRQLAVQRAWKRRGGLFELGEPKTRRSRRTLDLSDALVDMLTPHLAGKGPRGFVFTTLMGRPIRHANFYDRVWLRALISAMYCDGHRGEAVEARRLWRNAKARAKNTGDDYETPRPVLPGCGCPGTLTKRPRIHDLRHTHASWLIDDGIPLPEIQRRLGHESIQTTVDRYGHPSGATDAINQAVDRRLSRSSDAP